MRSKNDPRFVRHVDGAGYAAGQNYTHDEDTALEQAEAEINRLKIQIAELQATNQRLLLKIRENK